jgi:hypothetical protein
MGWVARVTPGRALPPGKGPTVPIRLEAGWVTAASKKMRSFWGIMPSSLVVEEIHNTLYITRHVLISGYCKAELFGRFQPWKLIKRHYSLFGNSFVAETIYLPQIKIRNVWNIKLLCYYILKLCKLQISAKLWGYLGRWKGYLDQLHFPLTN